MIGTRHDAVIKALENVLLTKTFIATGHKRYSAQPRRDKCTSCACAPKSVNHTTLAIPPHSRQLDRVPQHYQRIVARDIEWDKFAAGRRYVGDQATSARHDYGAKGGARENAHEVARACGGHAPVESRNNDEHGDRAERGLNFSRNNVRLHARFGD